MEIPITEIIEAVSTVELFNVEEKHVQCAELINFHTPSIFDNIIDEKEQQIYGESNVEDTTENIECLACNKKFTTQSSLKRHRERSPVCLQWMSINTKEVINYKKDVNIIDFIEEIKKK
jgi:hypothetical protein